MMYLVANIVVHGFVNIVCSMFFVLFINSECFSTLKLYELSDSEHIQVHHNNSTIGIFGTELRNEVKTFEVVNVHSLGPQLCESIA